MKNPIIKEKAGDPFILKDGENYYMTATGGGKEGVNDGEVYVLERGKIQ